MDWATLSLAINVVAHMAVPYYCYGLGLVVGLASGFAFLWGWLR